MKSSFCLFYKTKENTLLILGLVIIALCVCMLSPLNPFSKGIPGTDSSVFLTIAQGMLQGKLPYVDFFDHKGPLIYFINAFGLSIGGMLGVWFVELFLMLISVFFAYKIARFFSGKLVSFLATCFSFIVLSKFFDGGNLTEEYALPLIFISLYIFTRYCFIKNNPAKIQVVFTGLCFGASLLLRPNMFGVWFGFCIVILIQKLLMREYKIFFCYVLFFIIGMVIAVFPVLFYLQGMDVYNDFVYQYILFNSFFTNFSIVALMKSIFLLDYITLLLLIISFIWLPKVSKKNENSFFMAYLISLIVSIFLIVVSKHNHFHYYIVLIPLFIPALSFCIDKLFIYYSSSHNTIIRFVIPIVMLFVVFNKEVMYAGSSFIGNFINENKKLYNHVGEVIDKNTDTGDMISVLSNYCSVYLFTKRFSASKYIYQQPIISYSSVVKQEYLSDIMLTPPKILIIPLVEYHYNFIVNTDIYSPILSMINDEYTEIFISVGNIAVYKKK